METTISKAAAFLPANPTVEIEGVHGYIDAEGTAWLKLEDVAIGLEFTRAQTINGKVYKNIMWHRVREYLEEVDFCTESVQKLSETFIPENIFFRLIWKSRSEGARAFQLKVTDEILPALRKTGTYSIQPTPAPINDPIARMNILNKAVDAIGDMSTKLENVFGAKRGIALAKALKMVEATSGVELGELKGLLPAASEEEQGRLTPTQIGLRLGMTARAINNRLIELGLQERTETKEYVLTERGREYGEAFPYVSHGHSGWQIRWKPSVISILDPNDVQIDF